MQFIAQQAAEKLVWPVIPRSRRRRGISHWLENNQSEIPRSARNDSRLHHSPALTILRTWRLMESRFSRLR